jgi:tripartite-type tricarboxylate transporter receptor subunit TctC
MNAMLSRAVGATLACFAAVVLLSVSTQSAAPQARIIKLINPYPPGGTADIIARLVTEQINRTQGATFVIENRPGAGTVIGADTVARAAPDGGVTLRHPFCRFEIRFRKFPVGQSLRNFRSHRDLVLDETLVEARHS